jgi:PKHD-type hydroxylase
MKNKIENAWIHGLIFNPVETWKIIEAGQNPELATPLTEASVNTTRVVDTDIRTCLTSFLKSNTNDWLFKKLMKVIHEVNNQYFNYDIDTIESLQFTVYSEDVNGFYKKHTDTMYGSVSNSISRKLSFSVQLSDPSTYEGGDLLLHYQETPVVCNRKLGAVNFFPSYMLHEVTPVTKGTRYSLVGWVTGPSFR